MAIQFLNTVNFNKNQLNFARIQNLGADPNAANSSIGQIYFNTAIDTLKQYVANDGSGNPGWIEVGATSGVETLSTTQAGNSTGNTLTVLTNAVGDVTINSFAYAGGSNIGYVPSGGLVDQYMDGTGAWVDVTTGDIESVTESAVNNRLGIRITTPTGPDPVVGLDIIGQTNLGTTPDTADELIIYQASTTTNKSITVGNLVGGFETTYDLTTAPTGTAVRLTGSDSTNDDVTISGSANQIAVTRISTTELNVAFTPSISVADNINLGGVITQTGGTTTTALNSGALNNSTALVLTTSNTAIKVGMEVTGTGVPANITIAAITNSFTFTLSSAITIANVTTLTFQEINSFSDPLDMNNNRISEVKTGVLGTDAVNLAQVNSLIAGVGVFKGGYDASTDPGNPVISSNNNIALDLGDYFVVTAGGDITFSDTTVTVEVGDFIFAEDAIAAGGGVGTGPASTDYIIVIADANIATDGTITTAKRGVAGFDTTTFDVTTGTNAGFVTLKPTANPYAGQMALESGDNATAGETTFTLDITTLFGSLADARLCKVEILQDAGGLTVYPEVTRNGLGDVVVVFMPQVADDIYTALITLT